MLRITMPSLSPQSYDKQTLSENFTFVFPWKEQTVTNSHHVLEVGSSSTHRVGYQHRL